MLLWVEPCSPTAVETKLIVKVVEFLLDLLWTGTVLPHTEVQQHVDLKTPERITSHMLS